MIVLLPRGKRAIVVALRQNGYIDWVTGNFQSVNGCENGRHQISSDAPFGVTVWGWGSFDATQLSTTYVSYAYPAGASIQSINEVVVPPTPE